MCNLKIMYKEKYKLEITPKKLLTIIISIGNLLVIYIFLFPHTYTFYTGIILKHIFVKFRVHNNKLYKLIFL